MRRAAVVVVLSLLAAMAALSSPVRSVAQTPPPTLTLTPSSGPPGTSFSVSGRCPSGGGTAITQLTRDGVDVAEGSGAALVSADGSFSVPQRIPFARTPGATAGESEFFQPGARYAVAGRCPDGFQFAARAFDVTMAPKVALTG